MCLCAGLLLLRNLLSILRDNMFLSAISVLQALLGHWRVLRWQAMVRSLFLVRLLQKSMFNGELELRRW